MSSGEGMALSIKSSSVAMGHPPHTHHQHLGIITITACEKCLGWTHVIHCIALNDQCLV